MPDCRLGLALQSARPEGYCEARYWDRRKTMNLDPQGLSWNELTMRFSAHLPGVASCIVGTGKMAHFKHNLALLARGALDATLQQQIQQAFISNDDQWIGLI